MVKCFDTQQMSEKFRRHLECEIVQFQFHSDDFSKFAFLLADRTLEFHARYGFHYRTRIPKFGRDITYHKVLSYSSSQGRNAASCLRWAAVRRSSVWTWSKEPSWHRFPRTVRS